MAATNKTEVIDAAAFRKLSATKRGRKAAGELDLGFTPTTVEQVAHLLRLNQQATSPVVIEHEPMGAPRMVQSDRWRKRPVVLRYFALKDAIRAACEAQGYDLPGEVTVRFELTMPRSWAKKKRDAMRGKPHQQKPDIDNLFKGVADAFNEDDSHVHSIHATKVWADTGRIIISR